MQDLSSPPDGPRESVLARLRELEAAGIVDDLAVYIWGKSIPAIPQEAAVTRTLVHERVAEFRRWADRNGRALEPAFRRCEQSTMVSDERRKIIRLPLQCLAVYRNDCLAGVFPCTTDQGTNTVLDCLRCLGSADAGDRTPPEGRR